MWRTELFHPLIVHLPVVTLLLASVAGLLRYPAKSNDKIFLERLTFVMLAIGVVTGWAGIYTGQLAYNIEVRKICDPKVLQNHQYWSYVSVIIYTVALLLVVLKKYIAALNRLIINVLIVILLIAGGTILGYAGHLGASVVYEQGAGVHKPADDCSDYNPV